MSAGGYPLSRENSSLAFWMEARGMPLVRHAVIECCECQRQDAFPHTDRALIPQMIVKKFVRRGWEVYRSAKARCPDCAHKNLRRKAAFARRDDMQTTPVNKPQISLVKPPKPEETLARRQTYLVIVEGGVPSIQSLAGASEMLFGNKTYLVIPMEEEGTPDDC